jgi:hypothetical protein
MVCRFVVVLVMVVVVVAVVVVMIVIVVLFFHHVLFVKLLQEVGCPVLAFILLVPSVHDVFAVEFRQ